MALFNCPLLLFLCSPCAAYDVYGSDATSPSWATYSGVVQTSDGRTIACFGRTAYLGTNTSTATNRRALKQATTTTSLHSTAGADVLPALDFSQSVEFIWALSDNLDDGLSWHPRYGGFSLTLSDPSSALKATNTDLIYWIRVHSALLLVAWVVLAPASVILARHR